MNDIHSTGKVPNFQKKVKEEMSRKLQNKEGKIWGDIDP